MSVLESMRSGTDSTFMQVVFIAVVVSFVGWGVGATGNTTNVEATVNGEPITGLEVARVYRQQENAMSSQSDRPLTADDRAALKERVVEGLVRERALLQEAKALGLEVSNAEIAEILFEIPYLLDEDGNFDTRAYQNFLRRQGLTRADYEERLRESLLLQKLRELMVLGASISEPMVVQRWTEENTKLDLAYVRIRPGVVQAALEPTQDELDAFLEEREADVQARYDRDLTRRYEVPERVTARIIVLKIGDDGLGAADLKPRMDEIVAALDAGASFEDMVRKWSEDPSVAKGGLLSDIDVTALPQEVQDGIAGVEAGQVSEILVSDRDLRLYKVESREAARTVPLDEVRTEIATAIWKEEQAPLRAASLAEDQLLAQWKDSGEAPAALLESEGLALQQTGPISLAGPGGLVRPPSAMLRDARNAAEGDVLPEVYEENGIYWVGQLTSREDPSTEDFETQKDRIREQTLAQRRVEFYQSWEDEVVARAKVTR